MRLLLKIKSDSLSERISLPCHSVWPLILFDQSSPKLVAINFLSKVPPKSIIVALSLFLTAIDKG